MGEGNRGGVGESNIAQNEGRREGNCVVGDWGVVGVDMEGTHQTGWISNGPLREHHALFFSWFRGPFRLFLNFAFHHTQKAKKAFVYTVHSCAW